MKNLLTNKQWIFFFENFHILIFSFFVTSCLICFLIVVLWICLCSLSVHVCGLVSGKL